MMLLHKKIRFLRLQKNWSQETMAAKLDMSPNGYGSIERGETNVQISRILQIAKLFDINISELFAESDSQNIFNSQGSYNTEIQNNNDSRCYFNTAESSQTQTECQYERQQLEFNLEKQIIITEQLEKEVALLKTIHELMSVNRKLTFVPRLSVQRRSENFRRMELDEEEDRKTSALNKLNTNLMNC